MSDAYKCPGCGASPLQINAYELECGVFDDVLYCNSCGRRFEIVPGKEIEGAKKEEDDPDGVFPCGCDKSAGLLCAEHNDEMGSDIGGW